MRLYCKNCKRHAGNTFPKKLVLISNNKIKGKSRCFICLTERSFIDEVQYDPESALEIYLQFFKTNCLKQKILKQKIIDYLCSQNVVFVKIKNQDL